MVNFLMKCAPVGDNKTILHVRRSAAHWFILLKIFFTTTNVRQWGNVAHGKSIEDNLIA